MNKPGLAMVLALVMAGMSAVVVTRFAENTRRATEQTADRVQANRSVIRARELAEIGSAAVKYLGGPPSQWLTVPQAIAQSFIPAIDQNLMSQCVQRVGSLVLTTTPTNQWNIRPDPGRQIQRSSRFEVNDLQMAFARTRGYIFAGTMVDVENSVAALGVNPVMVIGCGLGGNELDAQGVSVVMVSMVTIGGQVVVGDIRER